MAIAFDASLLVTAAGALVISAQLVTVNNASAGMTIFVGAGSSKSVSSAFVSGLSADRANLVNIADAYLTSLYRQNNPTTSTSNVRIALNGGGGGTGIVLAVNNFTNVGTTDMVRAQTATVNASTTSLRLDLPCASGDMASGFLLLGGTGDISAWTTANAALWGGTLNTELAYLSASGATTISFVAEQVITERMMGSFFMLSATAVGSAAPSTAFVGGLAAMGCGYRIRWTLDDLFPPPLIPDSV